MSLLRLTRLARHSQHQTEIKKNKLSKEGPSKKN